MELESAIEIILQWNLITVKKDYVFDGYRQEINQYLQAVDRIQASIKQTKPPPPPLLSNDQIRKAKNAIQIAMARLADEFRNILILNTTKSSSFCDPDSNTWSDTVTDTTSYELPVEEEAYMKSKAMSSDVINDLQSVAERMNFAGHLQECTKVYTNVRKSILEASFVKLGSPKVNGGVRRLEGEDLDSIIKEWIRAVTISIKILFAYEKRLSAQIFHGIGASTADSCFLETVKDPVTQLLNFAELVSSVSPSTGKLFRILDLYKVWLELSPKLNDLFDSETLEGIRIRVAQVLVNLRELVGRIILEFENSVLQDESRILPVDYINSLPAYVNNVMNIVRLLCNHKQTFTHELDVSEKPSGANRECNAQTHPLSVHLIRIVENLVVNLERKSKLYKDASMAYLFTRNNTHFIVRQIGSNPRLREMIGPDYLNKLTGKLQQAEADHLNSISESMLNCLRDEGLQVSWICCCRVSRSELSERIKTFDALFEEVLHTLEKSVEVEYKSRDAELPRSILEKLIPAYTSFLRKFRSHIDSGNLQIKYNSAADLEAAMSSFLRDR